MKCKWGALVVDGRNKIGGHVASKNRAGSYFRTKVTPTNPGTNYQVGVRNRLAGISSAWRALTADQRTSWNAVVADFARTDIFGDLKNPTGFNLYQRLNNNLLNLGVAGIDTPPLPQAVDAFTSLSIAAAAGAQTLTVTFAPAIVSDHGAWILATPGLSAGISFVKSEYRQITPLNFNNFSPFDAETAYIVRLGVIPAAGTKLFVRMFQVHNTAGMAGIPIQASCIVAA